MSQLRATQSAFQKVHQTLCSHIFIKLKGSTACGQHGAPTNARRSLDNRGTGLANCSKTPTDLNPRWLKSLFPTPRSCCSVGVLAGSCINRSHAKPGPITLATKLGTPVAAVMCKPDTALFRQFRNIHGDAVKPNSHLIEYYCSSNSRSRSSCVYITATVSSRQTESLRSKLSVPDSADQVAEGSFPQKTPVATLCASLQNSP